MLQKCTILGLMLLLAGGAAFGWLYRQTQDEQRQTQGLTPASSLGSQEYLEKYGRWYQLSPEQQNQLVLEIDQERKSKTAEQLGQEQRARLRADLDKLASGQMNPGDIADFLYGRGWEDQVEQYKKHNEQTETAQTISVVGLAIGGVLFGGCMAIWLLGLVVRLVRAWRRRSSDAEVQEEPQAAELVDVEVHAAEPQEAPEAPMPEEQPKQRRKLLARPEMPAETASEPTAGLQDLFSSPAAQPTGSSRLSPTGQTAGAETGVALLLADEPSQDGGWSPQQQWSQSNAADAGAENKSQEQRSPPRSPRRPSDQERGAAKEANLKEQADDLQRQIAEFKQMAQSVQQATREQSAPLSSTLKELTQQVSAIREYAASQQDRVEKLQDGYDWGIIRTFCLRVIRCLDNLEGRLAELPKGDGAIQPLEEVRDELLFALESSGVEQYRPEINSEFHGQEKLAEALKEKQPTKKPEQAGKIAKVIRPGYRYVVDDENYRVVRTAQVKVYG
jgi:molecular chaperone GrpE (heat shock protein)